MSATDAEHLALYQQDILRLVHFLCVTNPDNLQERILEALATPYEEHPYVATSCWHAEKDGKPELHGYCQSNTGSTRLSGSVELWAKKPGECKFCEAKCQCPCHKEEEAA